MASSFGEECGGDTSPHREPSTPAPALPACARSRFPPHSEGDSESESDRRVAGLSTVA